MKRTIALPLLVIAFAVSVIFASRTPQIITEELPQEETGNPPLLTLTDDVGGQTVTLEVYEPNEEGFARYVLLDADGTQIDRGSESLGGDNASERFALTAVDDVLGFPGIEVTLPIAGYMIRHAYYALTEQGFVYVGEFYGHDFGTAWGDGAWTVDLDGNGHSELVTRSTAGDGVSRVRVYRWNAESEAVQHSSIDWEKADERLARLSAPLGVAARAEKYHAGENTVELTLYREGITDSTMLPLTPDILGEWE